MEPAAVATGVIGGLIVATRTPLVFAPVATLARYRDAIATPARVRWLGVLVGALGIPLALTAPRLAMLHPYAAPGLSVLGWFMSLAAAWLLVFPRAFRSVADGVLAAMDDPGTLRGLGLAATGLGAGLLWLAWEIR